MELSKQTILTTGGTSGLGFEFASRLLQDIIREIEINLMRPIRMVQQFLPHQKTKKNAAIMNLTSGIALAAFPIYSGSKFQC